MAQIEVSDLIDKATYTESFGGLSATRQFMVSGLDAQANGKLFQAAAIPGIPRVGQIHEGNAQLYVSQIDVNPVVNSPTKAWVLVTYGSKSTTITPPSAAAKPTIEVGATSANIETSRDKDGNEMTLSYTTTAQNIQNVSGILASVGTIDTTVKQPFKASVQESHPYFTFSRPEPGIFDFGKVLKYQNTVNTVPWFGSPARTWYCAAIRATLQGDNYQVSYEFQYREKTWDVEGVFIDPSTGSPVVAPIEGVGHAFFKVLGETDFSALNLV